MRWTPRSTSRGGRLAPSGPAGCRSIVGLALALALIAPTLSPRRTAAAFATGAVDALDRVVELVRSSPLDETRLARALEFAEEQRAVSTLLDRLTAQANDGNTHYAVGRIAELAGSPVRAFDAYHRAVTAPSPSARARGRLALFYWRTGAKERARTIAQEGWELPDAERERLALLLAPTSEARTRLVELAATRADWALEVARERGELEVRLAVADALERVSERIAALLDAGELDRARQAWLARANAEVPVELVYRLARALGDRTLFVDWIADVGVTPAAAPKLLESLDRSLGRVPGSDDSASDPDATTTDRPAGATTPTDPVGDGDENDRTSIVLPDRDDPAARASLRRSLVAEREAEPSLRRVLGWIRLGEADEARREWVRWQLDPDPEDEAKWLPVLLREPAAYFVRPDAPLRVLEEARRRTEPSPEFVERLLSALDRVTPGTALEARLLFQRGRLLDRRSDRERASRIAPNLVAQYRLDPASELTATVILAHAIESLPERFGSIDLPSPIDAPIGFDALGPARLAVLPVDPANPVDPLARFLDDRGPLSLAEWRDTARPPTPTPNSSDRLRVPRAIADDAATTIELDVSGIQPLTGLLRLPNLAYLAWGHGLAVFDFEGRKLWQVQRPEPLSIGDLPEPIARALPRGWASFLTATDPRASRTSRALEHPRLARFLDDVRARRDDPTVTLRSVLLHGDDWIVHTSDGVRALFRSGEAPVGPVRRRPPHADRASYALRTPSPGSSPSERAPFWQRTDEPVPPLSAASTPSSGFVRLARVLGPEPVVGVPEPPAPAVPVDGSDALRPRVFTAQWGPRRVEVTDDGWVLGFVGDGPARWALEIPTPLEGERGFLPLPERDRTPPLGLPRDQVLAGPASRRGVPRVTWDGGPLLVHTDRIWTVHDPWTSDANSTGVAVDPGPLELTGPLPGLRDVAIGSRGLAWLAGDALHLPESPAIVVPGAFDLVCLRDAGSDDTVFVLAQRYDLHLYRIDANGRRTEVPLPDGIVFENDRVHVRMSALGVWRAPEDDRLLLVHDDLYALDSDHSWERLVAWDEGTRPFSYWQRPPLIVDGRLFVVRPDGAWETWQAPTR